LTPFEKGFYFQIKLATLGLLRAFGMKAGDLPTKSVIEAFSKGTPARRTNLMLTAKRLTSTPGKTSPNLFSSLKRTPIPPGHPALQPLGKPLQIPKSVGRLPDVPLAKTRPGGRGLLFAQR